MFLAITKVNKGQLTTIISTAFLDCGDAFYSDARLDVKVTEAGQKRNDMLTPFNRARKDNMACRSSNLVTPPLISSAAAGLFVFAPNGSGPATKTACVSQLPY